MAIKRVIQLDDKGCGIACVAAVVGRSYTAVKRTSFAQGVHSYVQPYSTDIYELRSLLACHGIVSRPVRFTRSWKRIKELAIVGISRDLRYGWHWVVYVPGTGRGYVRDPSPTIQSARRVDFHRMPVRLYVAIDTTS